MQAITSQFVMPPSPQHAVLKRIYPWDEYDITLVMTWLYAQAQRSGFKGTFEDFKLRYGLYMENTDPQDPQSLIENYTGTYHVIPLRSIQQRLMTANKVLNKDIIIDAIPEDLIPVTDPYTGRYQVTPLAYLDQILRTENKLMEQDVTVEKIPYQTTSNIAGGYTAIIG